ncbi:LOW QUALITY PROTEIN: disintegrin and metalloproteinase domain-containing protein 18-like [Balearica regulorum gibbericeps]|uniref:LOW QUALITY PROTEIN: disintegrin and metalloproteinase domain-containing protein 18-like n=1 Tax=Balearica regulorum gibbericeps TaxID=100784 RepID=UPI003F62A9DE
MQKIIQVFNLVNNSCNSAQKERYRDRAAYVGATALGKACQRDAAGAVAVYQESVTLESFSILLAQLLGRSMGIRYDSQDCRCGGRICIMSPEALYFSGAKAFSSCSIRDFGTFLKHDGGECLFNRPRLNGASYRRAAVCGNGVVERGEQCDCGAAEACLKDKCCTKRCQFKPGVKCSSGLCCNECQFKQKNSQCRPPADAQCDLAEFCNGSSASCPPDLYVQDGHECEHGTGYCYKGRCRSPDLQCQRLYGRGSKNAPVACYEELNSQQDRFGHCGFQPRQGYKSCVWRNLRCGKLICTYPYSTPFPSEAAAVLYVQVREHLCISLDYLNAPKRLDPLLVPPGTKCGSGKVCINNTCHPHSVLGYDCDSEVKCHGHGVCNNKRHCHCHPGWKPPDCLRKGSRLGGSIDSGLQETEGGQYPRGGGGRRWAGDPGAGREGDGPLPTGLRPPGLLLQRALEDVTLAGPVLGSCVLLLILAGAICLVLRQQGRRCGRQPPSTGGPAAEEGSDLSEPEPEPSSDPEPDRDPQPEPGRYRGR